MMGDSLIHYINFPALAGALGSFERLRITSSSQSTQSRELYGKAWSIPSLNIHVTIFSFLSSEKPKKKSYIMIKPKLAKAVISQSRDPLQRHQLFLSAAHLAPPIISTLLRHCMLWAAVTTAFFDFLRASEFVAPTTTSFDPEATLLINDVTARTQGSVFK